MKAERDNTRSVRLTTKDQQALDQTGYVVIPSALDGSWVDELLHAFEQPEEDSGTQHVEIGPFTKGRKAWDALSHHPLIDEAARNVLGHSSYALDIHGRNPLPGFGQQGLHSDWKPRSMSSPFVVVTVIFMLDAFTANNGATRVVPGTHRVTAPISKSYAQPLAHHPQEVIMTGSSGSALILNGHLWHSGTRNLSDGQRRAVQAVIRAKNRSGSKGRAT